MTMKYQVIREKPVPAPSCSSQNPFGPIWHWTWISTAKGWWPQPWHNKSYFALREAQMIKLYSKQIFYEI